MNGQRYELQPGERAAYEKLPVPLCVLSTSAGRYRLLLVSDGLCALLGREREQLSETDLLCAVCAEDRDTARTAAEFAVINPGEVSRLVCRLKLIPSGEKRFVCSCRARHAEDGSYLLYLTCEAQGGPGEAVVGGAERLAGQSDARLFSLLQSGGYELIARWRCDLSENRLLEYEMLNERALAVPPGSDYDAMCAFVTGKQSFRESREKLADLLDRQSLLRRFEEGRTSFSAEYRRDESGVMPFWVTVALQTFRSPQTGRVECYACVFDVTEKVLERELMSRLTLLGYDVVGLLSVRSGECRYFRINKMHFGMHFEHNEDYQESIGGDIRTIIAPDQRDRLDRSLRIAAVVEGLRESSTYSVSYSMTTRDGRHRQKLIQFSYLDEMRDVIFFCKNDITRQYENEHAQIEQLRAAKMEADRANEAKSTFLSSMSHDLRTPLSGILGFTRLALGTEDPEKKQDYLEKVESSGTLLLDLVNDTLEMSRIESGKFVLDLQTENVRRMSAAVLTALGPSAEIKNLRLKAAPESFPDVSVRTDRLKFQKIFLNLLSNAIKYTPSGGEVSASVERLDPPEEGGNFRITVRDSGIGIQPEFLPHIFDAFSQEHRAESAGVAGTGLGLTIVKRIVALMNGRISVESEPERGSVFTVLLPLKIVDNAQTEERPALQPSVSLAGKRVLLCEDNDLNTEIARTLLTEQGILTDCAENGRTGAELFERSEPGTYAAVLMDIRMPVMDGYEATRFIRSLPRQDALTVPIIAMTADAFEEDIRNCRRAGMNRHLTKPIDPAQLITALQEEIEKGIPGNDPVSG